jgi:signal transduction histidine kinase
MLQKPHSKFAGLNRRGIFLFLVLWLFLPALGMAEPLSAQSVNSSICLTNAQQILQLDPATAAKGLPVRLHGVITDYDTPYFNLFIQDATAGVFILVPPDLKRDLAPGQEVEVDGICDKGDYAPFVNATAIRILGEAPLPAPNRISIDQLFSGSEDSQWVEVSGVVRSTAFLFDGRNCLKLAMSGQRVLAIVENLSQADALKLVNATIRIRGVCYSRFNTKRQMRVPWVSVSGMSNITIERPPPRQPEEISIAGLGQFNSAGAYGNFVKVSGIVTLQKRDGTFFVQDQGCGLYVQPAQSIILSPGDRVIISGYSARGRYVPALEDATTQFEKYGKLPLPVSTDLQTLFNTPENFDSVLVHLKAILVNSVQSGGQQTLVLQSSNQVFTATFVDAQGDERFNSLKIGSELALTGVFAPVLPEEGTLDAAESHSISVSDVAEPPESVQIFSRSFEDVTVVKQPSWWTARHALAVVEGMALLILLFIIWNAMLRGQVSRRTAQLANANNSLESEIAERKKVENELVQTRLQHMMTQERARIARDLHDDLGGRATQLVLLNELALQNRVKPEDAMKHAREISDATRQMIQSLDETVWAVNPRNDTLPDLLNYLGQFAVGFLKFSNVRCRIDFPDRPPAQTISAEARHNLYLALKEALNNIIRHSQAAEIWVRAAVSAESLTITVQDNGRGFARAPDTSTEDGLRNMRQRMEEIGGRFEIDSAIGKGTKVTLIFLWETSVKLKTKGPSGY